MCGGTEIYMARKPLTLDTIARVTGGEYIGAPEDLNISITGAVRDNRDVTPGSMFVCFTGERVDGHSFAGQAFDAGAACCLTEKRLEDPKGPYILTSSVTKALIALGGYYRSLYNIPVIGITGSVGKTTAKEMVASVLSSKFKVLKTPANLNNEIGVPLTLLSLEEEHEAAVIEMGISAFGEMSVLASMVRPSICVMTNIGYSHLEALGDLDGVLKEKSEVFRFMPAGSHAVLNGDDEKLSEFDPGMDKITFGFTEKCDYRCTGAVEDGTDSVSCEIKTPDGVIPLTIPAFGRHMILGAMPGVIVGRLLGLSDSEIQQGILNYRPVGGRANVRDTGYITIIDDCYNANPNSMSASILSLCGLSGRRVAILGDMKELGRDSEKLHRDIGLLAGRAGVDCLICLGREAEYIYKGYISGGFEAEAWHFPMKEAFYSVLPSLIKKGDTVLVKASHSMAFENIVEELLKLR